LLAKAKRDLELAGFAGRVTWNPRKTVHTAWVRVPDLMQQLGLAARREQQLSIKLEIDTRPPAGAELARAVVNRHLTFVVRHYTLSSLLAGKIHALITRPYSKGRDWYDLIWYAAQRPRVVPNLTLLQDALDQTHAEVRFDAARWPRTLEETLVAIDVAELARDVHNFLERPADRALLTRENLAAVLARW